MKENITLDEAIRILKSFQSISDDLSEIDFLELVYSSEIIGKWGGFEVTLKDDYLIVRRQKDCLSNLLLKFDSSIEDYPF